MQNIRLSNCLTSFRISFIRHKYRRGLSDKDRNVSTIDVVEMSMINADLSEKTRAIKVTIIGS